jgi:hypothetical protein
VQHLDYAADAALALAQCGSGPNLRTVTRFGGASIQRVAGVAAFILIVRLETAAGKGEQLWTSSGW